MNSSNSTPSSHPTKSELVSEGWIKSNYTLETRDDDRILGRGPNKNKHTQNIEEFVPPQMPRLYERLANSSIQLGKSHLIRYLQ